MNQHNWPTAGLEPFLKNKSGKSLLLFNHFIEQFRSKGDICLYPASTMIGIATSRKRIAWVTQLGKDFVHAVFPFSKPYEDNLCFVKIAKVPGGTAQFNHHFRMYECEDVNQEILAFMQIAYEEGK